MSMGRHPRAEVAGAGASARARRLFTLVAVVAVFLQAFIVHTHIDGVAGFALAAAIERAGGAIYDIAHVAPASHDTQSACPICEAMATAGTTVLASGPSLVSALGLIAHEAGLPIRLVAVRPTHAWQSRAPPIAL